MVSRVGVLALLMAVGVAVSSSAARTPPRGTAVFIAQHDKRLCPSPLCGGYWLALANAARTRCAVGRRRAHCYVASTAAFGGKPLAGDVPEDSLALGAIELGPRVGSRTLDRLLVAALFTPAGTAAVSGGYYRLADTGIRCVRAPCFSYRATQVNGSTRTTVSSVDLEGSAATAAEIARAETALRTPSGLLARGRFANTSDGGRVFRALRVYLRAPQPRA